MAELSTLARPYAKAVFELAKQANDFAVWSKQLAALAATTALPPIAAVLSHPALTKSALADIVSQAAGSDLGAQGQGLVKVLAANGRLGVVAELAQQFETLRADCETRAAVEITSAVPVADAQQKMLATAVAKKLGRAVEMRWQTDESLIAGAVIRAGDAVIDGSVRGQLAGLQTVLARP